MKNLSGFNFNFFVLQLHSDVGETKTSNDIASNLTLPIDRVL